MGIFIIAGAGFVAAFYIVYLIGSIRSIRTIRKTKQKRSDEIYELEDDIQDGEIVDLNDYLSKEKRKSKNDEHPLDSGWDYK